MLNLVEECFNILEFFCLFYFFFVCFRFKCLIEEGYSDGEEDFYFNEIDLEEDDYMNDYVFLILFVLLLILI